MLEDIFWKYRKFPGSSKLAGVGGKLACPTPTQTSLMIHMDSQRCQMHSEKASSCSVFHAQSFSFPDARWWFIALLWLFVLVPLLWFIVSMLVYHCHNYLVCGIQVHAGLACQSPVCPVLPLPISTPCQSPLRGSRPLHPNLAGFVSPTCPTHLPWPLPTFFSVSRGQVIDSPAILCHSPRNLPPPVTTSAEMKTEFFQCQDTKLNCHIPQE